MHKPPHHLEAEKRLIGGLFCAFAGQGPVGHHPDRYSYALARLADVEAVVQPSALWDRGCRAVYQAIRTLAGDGQPVGPLAVLEQLRADGTLADVPGQSVGVLDLAQANDHDAHLTYHAQLIADRARQRQLLDASQALARRVLDGGDAGQLADDARQIMDDAMRDQPAPRRPGWTDGATAVREAIAWYERPASPFTWGSLELTHPLDHIFDGFRDDEPWIAVLIGPPGSYKSALAQDLARRLAERELVYYVGFEESATFRLKRSIANAARLELRDVTFAGSQNPGMLTELQDELARSLARLRMLCGQPMTVTQLHRSLQIERALTADPDREPRPMTVIIDALQDLGCEPDPSPAGKGPAQVVKLDRRLEMQRIMQQLHDLKDHLPARILLLSHAARGGAGQGAYRTGLSAAKESSDIEYKADLLMTLGLEDVDVVPDAPENQHPLVRVTTAVHKHRAGRCADHHIALLPHLGQFAFWGARYQQRYDEAKAAKEAR